MTSVASSCDASSNMERQAAIDCGLSAAHHHAPIDADEKIARKTPGQALDQRLAGILKHPVEGVGRPRIRCGVIDGGREPVDVGPWTLLGRGELLGRGVARREDSGHRRGPSGQRGARRAEIDQGRLVVRIEDDIGGLDVAMQEPRGMHALQAIEQRKEQLFDDPLRQRSRAHQAMLECFAFGQRHDHVRRAIGFQEVVNPHDGGCAAEFGKGARLVEEAFASPHELLGEFRRARRNLRVRLS
jgi:hypothetical protein